MQPEKRLEELGIELPSATAPVASYVRSVRCGEFVYVSGQLPLINGAIISPGKVGEAVSLEQGIDAARQCAVNVIAALKAEVGDLGKISRIVKLVGFVSCTPDFTAQSQVVNGASELFLLVFGEAGRHARSAVGVASLPLDAPVEIELIAAVS